MRRQEGLFSANLQPVWQFFRYINCFLLAVSGTVKSIISSSTCVGGTIEGDEILHLLWCAGQMHLAGRAMRAFLHAVPLQMCSVIF